MIYIWSSLLMLDAENDERQVKEYKRSIERGPFIT